MHLAHREVVEAEREFGCGEAIRLLLKRQRDVEPDARRSNFPSAAICCLHDPRAAAGRDDVVAPAIVRCSRATAFGNDASELARFLIPAHLPLMPFAHQALLICAWFRQCSEIFGREDTCTAEYD